MAQSVDRHASRRAEDSAVFFVLILALFFIAFMMSIPIWLSGFVYGLAG